MISTQDENKENKFYTFMPEQQKAPDELEGVEQMNSEDQQKLLEGLTYHKQQLEQATTWSRCVMCPSV